MSLFDRSEIIGYVMMTLGIISVLDIFFILFNNEGGILDNLDRIMVAIGSVIVATMFLSVGNRVVNGTIDGKINILGYVIRIIGFGTIVEGIFEMIAAYIGDYNDEFTVTTLLLSFLLGIIIVWMSVKITDGRETTGDKIIWIVLVPVFLIMIVVNIMSIGDNSFMGPICEALIYVFMLAYLFDSDVRAGMNM